MIRAVVRLPFLAAAAAVSVPVAIWAMPGAGTSDMPGTLAWLWRSSATQQASAPASAARSARPSAAGTVTASAPAASAPSSEKMSILERRRRDRWKEANVEERPIKPFEERPIGGEARHLNQVGVYLTAGSAQNLERVAGVLERLQKEGGNALIVDVKGSRVYVQTDEPTPNELGLVLPIVDLPKILAMARGRGMYTMGRFIAVKDDGLSGIRPDVMVKNPNTGSPLSPGWVDPQNPLVLDYNGQVACTLAAMGIDEINLDYIRFSTAFVGDLRVFSGQQKADRVEKLVKEIRRQIDACGPRTRLGLSTYAILGWNYEINMETLGQDVKRFAPYVDVISPMAYPATFTSPEYYIAGKHPRSRMYWLVYRTLTGYRDLLGPEHAWKIRPWIQGYSASAGDIREQIDAVYDSGACGFTVWNAGNNYEPTYGALGPWEMPEGCK
jgi:hypothetical protein